MLRAKELSQADIQEIRSLRGKMPQAEIRKKFGIGTSRLYRIWKNGEEDSSQAAATPGTGQATLGANGKEDRAPAAANSKEARTPAGANGKGPAAARANGKGQAPAGANSQPTDAAVLQALVRIEEQMGRLEQQQALLLEAQEGHYEDVEELEGTVEQIAEAETNILDNLEAGSQQVRTTAENCAAAANAGKDAFWGAFGLGALALALWLLFWPPVAMGAQAQDSTVEPPTEPKGAKAQAQAQDSTGEPPPTEPKVATPALHKPATATAGSVAPHKPKKGLQKLA